jgi:hypothetical protein
MPPVTAMPGVPNVRPRRGEACDCCKDFGSSVGAVERRLGRFCCWRPAGLDDSGDKQLRAAFRTALTEGRSRGGTKRTDGKDGIGGKRTAFSI